MRNYNERRERKGRDGKGREEERGEIASTSRSSHSASPRFFPERSRRITLGAEATFAWTRTRRDRARSRGWADLGKQLKNISNRYAVERQRGNAHRRFVRPTGKPNEPRLASDTLRRERGEARLNPFVPGNLTLRAHARDITARPCRLPEDGCSRALGHDFSLALAFLASESDARIHEWECRMNFASRPPACPTFCRTASAIDSRSRRESLADFGFGRGGRGRGLRRKSGRTRACVPCVNALSLTWVNGPSRATMQHCFVLHQRRERHMLSACCSVLSLPSLPPSPAADSPFSGGEQVHPVFSHLYPARFFHSWSFPFLLGRRAPSPIRRPR
jgi:hypothetical protein